MATLTRQPFAPLDGTRLQTLTSLKNRQNALSNSPSKRKASEVVDADDFENLDPVLFSKRSKGADSFFPSPSKNDLFKPSSFVLTKSVSTPTIPAQDALASPIKPASASARPRSFLKPKSPAARLNTKIPSTPLTAPAGRSPTRGSKRIGILSRRRTARLNPPSFGILASAAPFSLDAALKGTIPSYGSSRSKTSSASLSSSSSGNIFGSGDVSASWFFDIHEDTPEQEMTNLLQHSTCALDISSDEESELRLRRERAEGRDKENVPPADDVSQTNGARGRVRATGAIDGDDMVVEKARGPLIEMNAADYYADGCDDSSVVVVPGDEDEEEEEAAVAAANGVLAACELEPEVAMAENASIDEVMGKEDAAAKAAVLQPIEGTGESFELWESGSAKEDGAETQPASSAPAVDKAEGVVVAVC